MTSSSAEQPRHLALVGMMGSGKSVIGRRAARILSRPFVDLDQSIELAAGSSIPEIFERVGEAGFRSRESEVLEFELQRRDPIVLATGGGVVLLDQNRALLADAATVVWLKAGPGTLTARVGMGHGRPLLVGSDMRSRIEDLIAEREHLYEAAADWTVQVDALTVAEAADEALRAVPEAAR